MARITVLGVVVATFFAYTLAQGPIQVNTTLGLLTGRTERSLRNVSFYAFQSIPYGKAPVGELRFKDPQAAEPWQGVLDAGRVDGPICYQTGLDSQEIESEDCLRLNVYTPRIPDNQTLLPVMFYIHGGSFLNSHSNFYGAGPHYLMENDVIVVTALYRLGPFGFLSTGDETIPGNFGLKDQNLALKWVKDNIKNFGGDPDKVTIFGQDAGAVAVTYHTLSPKSKGLFRAAISQSGSALCPWSYQRNHREIAYQLASDLNATLSINASSQELLKFLTNVSANDLRVAANMYPWSMADQYWLQGFSFTPVIEPEYDGAFFSDNMYDVIYGGNAQRVPLLIGINSEELLNQAGDLTSLSWMSQEFDTNTSYLVNNNMHISDQATLQSAGEAVRKIYTDGRLQLNVSNTIRFFSDSAFSKSIVQHTKLQSQWGTVYFYQFSYDGVLGGNNLTLTGTGSVQHGEELAYIWCYGNVSNLNSYPESDILTSDRLRGLWTNFAKNLNPTPEKSDLFNNVIWPAFKSSDSQYININENLTIEANPKGDVFPGWISVYAQYGVRPFDTF